jgi:cytochrome c-type biogenesis protein CcsB
MSVETYGQLSNNFVYSAIAVYAFAMLTYAAELAMRTTTRGPEALVTASATGAVSPATPARSRNVIVDSGRQNHHRDGVADRWGPVGSALTVLAGLLLAGGVLTRGLAAGRVPWGNMYEFAIVAALTVTAAYLAFLRREHVRDFGVWVVALVLLALGLAVTVLYTPAGALVPVLNSYWLVIHVAAAIVSGGVFTVAAIAAALFLVKHRSERRTAAGVRPGRYAALLPSSSTLDRVGHAATLFAFPIWTFAVIAGAIWAENSWGRYWGWDPKETWAFITWVLYAWVAWPQGEPVRGCGLPGVPVQLLRGQHVDHRPALLRRRLRAVRVALKHRKTPRRHHHPRRRGGTGPPRHRSRDVAEPTDPREGRCDGSPSRCSCCRPGLVLEGATHAPQARPGAHTREVSRADAADVARRLWLRRCRYDAPEWADPRR